MSGINQHTVNCPYCNTLLNVHAEWFNDQVECCGCGRSFQLLPPPVAPPPAAAMAPRGNAAQIAGWAIVSAAVLILIFVYVRRGETPHDAAGTDGKPVAETPVPEPEREVTSWRDRDNSGMAYIMMQHYVEDRLAAPRSARFPSRSSRAVRIIKLSDNTYAVNASVDAQNACGAHLRKPFGGRIKQTGRRRWELLDLNM